MSEFAKKCVLITGALGGIGTAITDRFADSGATVILADRDADALARRAGELRQKGIQAAVAAVDLRDAKSTRTGIEAAVATTGPVDVLVNNAGGTTFETLATMTVEGWHDEVDLNLNGAFHAVAAVIDAMLARRQGAIVNISSLNAFSTYGNPAYSAAKAGLLSYTKAMAVEYGRFGIRSNAVCPGTVRTPAWTKRVENKPEIFESLRRWYPLGRVAEPSDVAKAVTFLASDEQAGYISGAILTVDGGLSAGNRVMASEVTQEPI